MSSKMKKRTKITVIALSAVLAVSTALFIRAAVMDRSAENTSAEQVMYYEI